MKISYNWLNEYLPVTLAPQDLSAILTSIGLEVESMEKFEEVKGSLEGLVIGEIVDVWPHPNADQLKLTRVNIGTGGPLRIVCGAPNVAAGQKVVVATVGTTLYPRQGEPMTMKTAKIRGEESQGMICAEDEIGLGDSHAGIMVLENGAQVGMKAKDYFQLVEDWIFEIGLTPNRMDAMSHLGVARDVCAYLNNREPGKNYQVQQPIPENLPVQEPGLSIQVQIENTTACPRYSGVALTGVTVGPSPQWLQRKLRAIGIRPINNIVDITNFVLHECGQPLHAFDASAIKGNTVVVKNLPAGTSFVTLDEKERKLSADDLMICNASEGMCMAGVFGGLHSGVKENTTQLFLESACFNPASIRATSFRHGLRTDAASRFEKGTDISNTLFALKRAAQLIVKLAGGQIASEIIDVYPQPKEKTQVTLAYDYLHRLSGKAYPPEKVQNILHHLGFDILHDNAQLLRIAVPFSKPDISLPADVVEEVMRIDGLDNIEIPRHISISPSHTQKPNKETAREKIAQYLSGNGFHEIFTNSITNSQYLDNSSREQAVKMINNLSAELDVMRPGMLETGLECIAFNLNRKNNDLLFYEFGKTYRTSGNSFEEKEHLSLYITGYQQAEHWQQKQTPVDFFFLKGFVNNILSQLGLHQVSFSTAADASLAPAQAVHVEKQPLGILGAVNTAKLQAFDIKQPVWYADLDWEMLLSLAAKVKIQYREIPKFPAVRRDLALVLDKGIPFEQVQAAAQGIHSRLLQQINLFDVFESEKLGANKKSYAIRFTFQDPQKTLTDKEIDNVMDQLINTFETRLQAEIRK